ncbi:hypothetical protein [Roseomonas sp. 18066]|uniref:hypothetical protein n=1 Tax=Roseomonas sp. 18066 TaxID=2681412 RepID=UPI00135BF931|nr:hypothetical protein [Roseomonas sp. 18066]
MPRRYFIALLGSLGGSFALFYLALFGLGATGHLPPPGFANSICVDEKLAHLRDRPPQAANLLVIGSSIAWRHFDGDVVRNETPQAQPLNGAFCGLTINQSTYAADWLLGHNDSVREVLLIASPHDFENCGRMRTAVFDAADADAFVYGGSSPWPYYIKYFAPAALLRNALTVGAKRQGGAVMDPLVFDRYASGPMENDGVRDTLLYGPVRHLDQACFDALDRFAREMRRSGRRLMVASTPMHPAWKRQYDPSNVMQDGFGARVRQVLAASGGEYWDGDGARVVSEAAFYDAIHLHWSAVAPYSAALARHFQFGVAPPAAAASLVGASRL